MNWSPALIPVLVAIASSPARADEYEASLDVSTEGGLAFLGEDGTGNTATVPAAGLTVGVTYGLSNLVALQAEVAGGTYGRASFDDVVVVIGGMPQPPGTLARTTQFGRAVVGATLRFGVRWIPTVGAEVGVGARVRGHATFSNAAVMDVRPDDDHSGFAIDALATVHVGLDYRINAHWIAGLDIAATHAIAFDGPAADAVTGRLGIAYYWYPL